MVPSVCNFESLTLWIQLHPGLRDRAWIVMNGHSQSDWAVYDNIFEVLFAGSLSYLYSWLPTALFYLHRGTSLIQSCWHVSRGGRPLASHFTSTSIEMTKFVHSALKTLFYYPWTQAALFLIILISNSFLITSSLMGGFCRFHFSWSFRFQQIIFYRC